MTAGTDPRLEIRPYRDDDEQQALSLLKTVFGEWPGDNAPLESDPAAFFRWKHMANPFGRSIIIVAVADEQVVSLRPLMRWRFRTGDTLLHAAQAVDTATHPEYRGRGLYGTTGKLADEVLLREMDFTFGFPNQASLGATAKSKRGGSIGDLQVSIRVHRPIRAASNAVLRGALVRAKEQPPVEAETAADVLADADGISELLEGWRPQHRRIATDRSLGYLRWRYGERLDYRAVRKESAGRLTGLAIFRVHPKGKRWETRVTELIVAQDDLRAARAMLRDVSRAARTDLMYCCFSGESTGARAWSSYAPFHSRGRVNFAIRVLRQGISPDPIDMASWYFSLGDTELF